ncbi:MAG: hypothetical protein HUJ51_05935 [Eggerthellaceae bacterium]|nr:hypothetical protein [Eggerthellaceae bacterium]
MLNFLNKKLTTTANIIWNAGGSSFYLFACWITTVLVVILANGYAQSGALAVAMATGNLYATIVLFKSRTVQVSDVKSEFSTDDFLYSKIFTIGIGVIFCLIYCVLTVSLENYFVVLLYIIFRTCDCIVDVFHGIDQNHNRLDFAGISFILRGVFIIVGFSIGLVCFNSLEIAILLMIIPFLIVIIVFDLPMSHHLENFNLQYRSKKIFKLFQRTTLTLMALMFSTAVVSLSRQMFDMRFGNSQLGIYAAVATPSVIIQAMISYIYIPLLGPLAKLWNKKNFKILTKRILQIFLAFITLTLIIFILYILYGELALRIVFDEEIASHAYLLPAVLICTSLTAMFYFMQDLLLSFRIISGTIISGLISFLISLICANSCYDTFNMNGISINICIAFSVGLIIATVFLIFRTYKGIKHNKKN